MIGYQISEIGTTRGAEGETKSLISAWLILQNKINLMFLKVQMLASAGE